MNITDQHRRVYDTLADEYELRVATRSTWNLSRVRHFSRYITTGTRVLDVGCAVGMDIQHFVSLGYRAVGVELSPNMAAYARRRNPGVQIFQGDFLSLDIPGRFDAVFARAFIHIFPKDIAQLIVAKIYDLLKDDGVAFFGVSGSDQPWEGWLAKDDYSPAPKRYKKFWTEAELTGLLKETGFTILEVMTPIDSDGKQRLGVMVRKKVI